MTTPVYLQPLNSDAAQKIGQDIDSLLGQISSHEMRLASSYARLGGLLREVKIQQYWIALGYDRFSTFLEYVRERIDRRRSQVYAILSVAETLLPFISEEKLEEIGVTKAHELRRLVREGGSVESEIVLKSDRPEYGDEFVRLMDYAADPKVTAAQLRVKVNELLHCHEAPRGNWYELSGFYATADERKEIEQFWELGRRMFAPPDEQADHVWRGAVFMAAVREAMSTWLVEENG